MARDECRDCEVWSPGGEGFTEGRCPRCYNDLVLRRPVPPLPPQEEPPEPPSDSHLEV